jgi:hypothetical protein
MTEELKEEYEDLYLSNIESQNKMAILEVEAFATKMINSDTKSEDIAFMIRRLGEYEKYFLLYNPIVESFTKMGKPNLSQRLEDVLSDIRGAALIFQQAINRRISAKKIGKMSEEEKEIFRQKIFTSITEKN